jgi:hypothetical protein
MKFAICVAWHNETQKDNFLKKWDITKIPDYLILQQDLGWKNCAKTKNLAIEEALRRNAEIIVVLDDDCFPTTFSRSFADCLTSFAAYHIEALKPQPFELFEAVTDPPSRGTTYQNRTVILPVAASMGFWDGIPDYDALSQLVHKDKKMTFHQKLMFWRFFPFSGMNCAFSAEFWPHFKFDEEHQRFDDIFMGYRLQREAYKRGYCISLKGPIVYHSRQSNVWANLKVETENLEKNETYWKEMAGFF